MHSSFVARANALNHERLMDVAKKLAAHFDLNANMAVLETLVFSNKNPEVLKLRQSEAIIDLLNEIGRQLGVEGMEKPAVSSDDMANVPDAGDEAVNILEAEAEPVQEEPVQEEKPKASAKQTDDKQVPVVDDPRPTPRKQTKDK
jgi:hypothetical protein